jgi:hypothetical protein
MLFTQCSLEKDDVLPNAIPYTGNQLKMNGYYYQITYNNEIYSPLVMYSNGALITLGGVRSTLEEMDEYIRKNYIQDTWYKKNKYVWGVFFINNNTIQINQLSQDYPHRGRVQEGVILNDTTFSITKFSSGGKVREKDEIYHFREFSPKPDSTNVYIK